MVIGWFCLLTIKRKAVIYLKSLATIYCKSDDISAWWHNFLLCRIDYHIEMIHLSCVCLTAIGSVMNYITGGQLKFRKEYFADEKEEKRNEEKRSGCSRKCKACISLPRTILTDNTLRDTATEPPAKQQAHPCCSAKLKGISAYLQSKQILPFDFARRRTHVIMVYVW